MKRRPLSPCGLDPSRRVVFLALAESDMRQASEAVSLALKDAKTGAAQSPSYLALSEIAIVRYARPFCASRVVTDDPKKLRNVALGSSYVPVAVDPRAAILHEYVMLRRSSIVAHSDMRNRNIVLDRDKRELALGHWFARVHCTYLRPQEMHNLRLMADAIASRLHTEVGETAQAQFGHVPEGHDVQVAGGDPIYIAALQDAWITHRSGGA